MKKIHFFALILFVFFMAGCNQSQKIIQLDFGSGEIKNTIASAESNTQPPSESFIFFEKEGISIQFLTDFKTQEDGTTWFGPKGSQPGTEDYHLYNIKSVEKRNYSQLMTEEASEFTTIKPEKLEINNLSVVKWAKAISPSPNQASDESEVSGCETRYFEILGQEENIQFTNSHGCHSDRETDFKYMQDVIQMI